MMIICPLFLNPSQAVKGVLKKIFHLLSFATRQRRGSFLQSTRESPLKKPLPLYPQMRNEPDGFGENVPLAKTMRLTELREKEAEDGEREEKEKVGEEEANTFRTH